MAKELKERGKKTFEELLALWRQRLPSAGIQSMDIVILFLTCSRFNRSNGLGNKFHFYFCIMRVEIVMISAAENKGVDSLLDKLLSHVTEVKISNHYL